jgi:glycosyltransferase involved in cell wall biosynthesis
MKIGIVTLLRPHPERSGTRIRLFHFCRLLAKKHEVYLADLEQDASLCMDSGVERFCREIHRIAVTPAPLPGGLADRALLRPFSAHPNMLRNLGDWFRRHDFDAIIAAKSLGYYHAHAAGMPKRTLRIIDDGATAHLHYRNTAALEASFLKKVRLLFQSWKLKRTENALMQVCDCIVTPSLEEGNYLGSLFGKEKTVTVPNGVDVDYFGKRPWKGEGSSEILFFGTFRFEANVDAARYLVDRILPHLPPHQTVCLVGEDPPADLRDRAGRDPRIRITGYVEDLRPFLERSLAVAIPLRIGTGTRLKVLHAMAAGCPVIATRLGAEGIGAVDGKEIVIADSVTAFARAIARIESDHEFARSISTAARRRIAQSYDWTAIVAEFERELSKRVTQKAACAAGDNSR